MGETVGRILVWAIAFFFVGACLLGPLEGLWRRLQNRFHRH